MKTMRQLFVLAMLAVSLSAAAQDDLRYALIDYIKVCPSALSGLDEQMGEILNVVNNEVIKDYNGKTSEELTKDYMEHHFVYDLVGNVLLPAAQEFVTIDEVKQLTAIMSSPEGQLFQEHQRQVNAHNDEVGKLGENVMETLLAGVEPDPIDPPAGCPQEYQQLFAQYFDLMNLGAIAEQLSSLEGMTDDANTKKMLEYLQKNMCNIYLNQSYGIMTTDDLQFGVKVHQTDAWQHMVQASAQMMKNTQQTGMGIIMGYIGWLQEQGVELGMEM